MKKYFSLLILASVAIAQTEEPSFTQSSQKPDNSSLGNNSNENPNEKMNENNENSVNQEIKINSDGTLNLTKYTKTKDRREHIRLDSTEHTYKEKGLIAGGSLGLLSSLVYTAKRLLVDDMTTKRSTQNEVIAVLVAAGVFSFAAQIVGLVSAGCNMQATGHPFQQIKKTDHTLYVKGEPNLKNNTPLPNDHTTVTVVSSDYRQAIYDSHGIKLLPPSAETDKLREDVETQNQKTVSIKEYLNNK